MTRALFFGGTWDVLGPKSMLGPIGNDLADLSFDVQYVPYFADYGRKHNYRESLNSGMVTGLDILFSAGPEERFQLFGYSQGAAVVNLIVKSLIATATRPAEGTPAEMRGNALKILNRIDAVFLVADPNRQPGHIVGEEPGGRGIAFDPAQGWFGDYKEKVFEFCAKGDIIGSTDPETTLLHRLPIYTKEFNSANMIEFVKDALGVVSTINPLAMYPELRRADGVVKYLRRWHNTRVQLKAYLDSGVHTKYQKFRLPTGALAFDWIVDQALRSQND